MLNNDGNENEKKLIGLKISKKQLCTCSTLFLYFFLRLLHDYNVKSLGETS